MSGQLGAIRSLPKTFGIMAFGLMTTSLVWAQSPLKAAGEVASASRTTIGGSSAISGMTVFSDKRIRTADGGAAVVNLGKLGRTEFGAETDMTLRFSAKSVGGELRSGRLVVSTPAGVDVVIKTERGLVTTDGQQSAVLTINVGSARAQVVAHRGEASVISGSDVIRVPEGGELALSPRGGGWQHTRPIAGAARVPGQIAKPVTVAVSPNPGTLTGLFKQGVNYSIDRVSNIPRDPARSFNTTMTCRDSENISCRRWGSVTP